MSPLVTRPSLPEALTFAGSTPLSAARRETAGPESAALVAGFTGVAPATSPAFFCASAEVSAPALPAAWATAVSAFFSSLAGAAALPSPAAMVPSSALTPTVSPSLATISPSTPAAGALTSSVTLSVSSSTKGSSAFTASPGFLNHLPMVASETDSPRVGTRISVAMSGLFSCLYCLSMIPKSGNRFSEKIMLR